MSCLSSRTCLVVGILLWGTTATGDDVRTLTPGELLQLLKARDSQVDNACLSYQLSSQVKRDSPSSFDAWKSGQLEPVPEEPMTVIDFVYDEKMIIRGGEVTFDRVLTRSSHLSGTTDIEMLPQQKWSNRGDALKELTSDGSDKRYSKVLEVRPKNVPVSIADEQRMEIEFALGFGYGKRLKQIDTVTRNGDLWDVRGGIQIWWEDESTIQMTLDQDFIVRSAVIQCDVRGNLTRFDIETEGTIGERFAFARNGHFTRTWMGRRDGAETRGEPQIQKEFGIKFVNVDWDLSDADYGKLTAIETDDKTQIIDRTGRHTPSHVDAMKGGEDRTTSSLTSFLIANLIAIIVVAFVWGLRRKWPGKGGPVS